MATTGKDKRLARCVTLPTWVWDRIHDKSVAEDISVSRALEDLVTKGDGEEVCRE